jgi:pyridoxine 5-phosphate synthase
MACKLSVNINKIATIRNARGSSKPSVLQAAIDCQAFGADGITVHPRPDERHITKQDVYDIAPIITTEFNIEGRPNDRFMKMVEEVKPHQATLVPDTEDVLTSDAGWDTITNETFLTETIGQLKSLGIRTSLFIETDAKMIEGAAKVGADRIEFYTGPYADNYAHNRELAISEYVAAAEVATQLGLGINAGHDLSLDNLKYFVERIPNTLEVSIGHALISDALYFGLENTINMYKNLLK